MTSTFGFTIQDWKNIYQQNPKNIMSLLTNHIAALDPQDNSWIYIANLEQIQAQIEPILEIYLQDRSALPLFGMPFAVKDNIDVKDWPTTAACPAFTYVPKVDSFVVAKLKAAGAIVIGKTNLDQYATGLVGTRTPFGKVCNTFNPEYISGGSSSGSASVLARGLVCFSLGTDTAGSGRIPAGFNNIIGLKPTKGWLSCKGIVPACRLNDTISIFALTVEDAFNIAMIAGGYDDEDAYSRMNPCIAPADIKINSNFAIPENLQFLKDKKAKLAWKKALKQLQLSGVNLHLIDFSPFQELAKQLYEGPWVAERTLAVGEMLNHPEEMDPIVYNIINNGLQYKAVDAYKAEYLRAELTRHIQKTIEQFDALIVPTSPTIYKFKTIEEDPVNYNSQLGIYTNFTNLADLCALALPGPFRDDGLPAGITLIAPAWHDRALAKTGLRWQQHISLPLGATGKAQPVKHQRLSKSPNHIRLAVLGAHLTGMPLNYQLTSNKATLVKETQTAPCYRMFALLDEPIEKPGLLHDKQGNSITVELWDIPLAKFGEFMMEITSPLGIGSIKLIDGQIVNGMLCEHSAIKKNKALEITKFGSWRNWLASISRKE